MKLHQVNTINERKLTPAELKKREEIAKAIERDQPGIDKSKKMAIATAAAKRVKTIKEFDGSEYVKVGEVANHGLIGNVKVLRITGSMAEVVDPRNGKHFRVQLSSLTPGAQRYRDESALTELDSSTLRSYVSKRTQEPTPRSLNVAGRHLVGVRGAKERIHAQDIERDARHTGDSRISESAYDKHSAAASEYDNEIEAGKHSKAAFLAAAKHHERAANTAPSDSIKKVHRRMYDKYVEAAKYGIDEGLEWSDTTGTLGKKQREQDMEDSVKEATGKAPTARQVQAAKDKYDSFGLKIENAKKKAGYARGTGVVGDLQQKKGQAYNAYMDLKRAYDASLTESLFNVGDPVKVMWHTTSKPVGHGTTNIDKVTGAYAYARHPETGETIKVSKDTGKEPGASDIKGHFRFRKLAESVNAPSLHVGDPLKIVGNVQHAGETGVFVDSAPSGRFIIVRLDSDGTKHSFHESDVEYYEGDNEDDDIDESTSSLTQQQFTDYVMNTYYVYGGNDEDDIMIEDGHQKYRVKYSNGNVFVSPDESSRPANARAREIKHDIVSQLSESTIQELSTNKLAQYKTKAGAYASAADKAADIMYKAGDKEAGKRWTERADKKFKGIVKATNKQFKNDANMNESHKVNDRVTITKGPKDAIGKTGHIGEIRHGAYKNAPKTYTIDYNVGDRTASIQLSSTQFKSLKESSSIVGDALSGILNEARIPLQDHPYHKKTDAELKYIIKDAGESAKSMKGHDSKAESKYLDQVNDASTVLYHRKNKKIDEVSAAAMGHAGEREWTSDIRADMKPAVQRGAYCLTRDKTPVRGQGFMCFKSEKEAIAAWKELKNNTGVKIVRESADFDDAGNQLNESNNLFLDPLQESIALKPHKKQYKGWKEWEAAIKAVGGKIVSNGGKDTLYRAERADATRKTFGAFDKKLGNGWTLISNGDVKESVADELINIAKKL